MTEGKKHPHVKLMLFCSAAFVIGLLYAKLSPRWLPDGYAGRAKTALQFGGSDMREIVAVWCDQNRVLVVNPFSGEWQFLYLEGQCAKSCDPRATHLWMGRSVECEWVNAKTTPKPLIPEKPKIMPAVSLAKGGAQCSKQS